MPYVWRVETPEGKGLYQNRDFSTYPYTILWDRDDLNDPYLHPDPSDDEVLGWLYNSFEKCRFGFSSLSQYSEWVHARARKRLHSESPLKLVLYHVPNQEDMQASERQAIFDLNKSIKLEEFILPQLEDFPEGRRLVHG